MMFLSFCCFVFEFLSASCCVQHLKNPTASQLTSMHFYGWEKGLKTGSYYIHSKPATDAIQFTVDQKFLVPTASSSCDKKEDKAYRPNKPLALSIPSPLPNSPGGGGETPSDDEHSSGSGSCAETPEGRSASPSPERREEAEVCRLSNREGCTSCGS